MAAMVPLVKEEPMDCLVLMVSQDRGVNQVSLDRRENPLMWMHQPQVDVETMDCQVGLEVPVSKENPD